MRYTDYTQAELEALIKRYFDGATTYTEEKRLRIMLTRCRYSSQTINEARAVMGFFAACRQHVRTTPAPKRFPSRRHAAAAAVTGIILLAGALTLTIGRSGHDTGEPDNAFLAYSGGRIITDRNTVSALAELQMKSVFDVSRRLNTSVKSELQTLSEVLDKTEIQ